MSFSYPNVLEANRGLLLDVCKNLNELQSNYVIVGGWVPYLRTVHETLRHPGTKDVDVLLNDDKQLLQLAVKSLLGAGYVLSAKHPFQLLRTLKVKEGDGDREFVFNVDLMHPAEGAANPDKEQLTLLQNFLGKPEGRFAFDSNVKKYITGEMHSDRRPADEVTKLLFE